MGKTWFELDIPVRFANCSYDNWRSFIFDMPEGSRYAGYTFAHPRKLTRRACGRCL